MQHVAKRMNLLRQGPRSLLVASANLSAISNSVAVRAAARLLSSSSTLPLEVRKLQVTVEQTEREQGQAVSGSFKVAAAIAIRNPYAGQYVADLGPMFELGAAAAELCADKAITQLKAAAGENIAASVDAYGKACIVGTEGELEHSAAMLHPKFGTPVRVAVGGGDDIIP